MYFTGFYVIDQHKVVPPFEILRSFIYFLLSLILFRVAGALEPIPKVIGAKLWRSCKGPQDNYYSWTPQIWTSWKSDNMKFIG